MGSSWLAERRYLSLFVVLAIVSTTLLAACGGSGSDDDDLPETVAGAMDASSMAADDADLAFAGDEREGIGAAIARWELGQVAALEHEIFKQRKRLADAERALATKPTKKAADDQRIATNKVEGALERLADLKRAAPLPKDSRIFPGMYAPVMVLENGRRVLRPMRYQCRPEGKPVVYDRKYPGTYNARRDNLEVIASCEYAADYIEKHPDEAPASWRRA